jgi:PUA domain protein
MRIVSRHHLRSDGVQELTATLEETFGITIESSNFEAVEIADSPFDIVLVDGEPIVFELDGDVGPTVKGANEYPPSKHVVTVDAGAVSFVSDGADIMRPGIVDADPNIEADDLVLIKEETHGKILAVGRSRAAGTDLVGDAGKVIDSIHHVGDDLYDFSP